MNEFLKDSDVREALSLAENANLAHPASALLSCFILDALNPQLAAKHVLEGCRRSQDLEAVLLSLVSDWSYIVESIFTHGSVPPAVDPATRAAITRRDGSKCCITGKAGSIWDPLIVSPILPIPSRWVDAEPRILNMLGAFFTPSYRDWWLDYAQNPRFTSPYGGHWLVRKSAAGAFAQGLIKLDRLQPSMIEYAVKNVSIGPGNPVDLDGSYPLLGDHSRRHVQTVDARFIGTHARLATAIQYVKVAKEINIIKKIRSSSSRTRENHPARDLSPSQSRPFFLTNIMSTAFLPVWLTFPNTIRLATYKILQKIGHRIYGKPDGTASVQRLPFGLYLKYNGDPEGFSNEFNSLKVVRKYTSVPVPRPIDCITVPSKSADWPGSHDAYLITTRIPGVSLADCQETFSDEDGAEFVTQMQGYVAQIRSIPKTIRPEYAICNTLGQACRDPRIRGADPVGPFADEAAFSQVLRYPDDPSRRGHKIIFTHADLNTRNIIVDRVKHPDGTSRWKVTGIVDWENSGYYPEYWDYTKALFEGFRSSLRWRRFLHDIFKPFGDLSKEFEIEERSWGEGDAI